MAALYLRSLFLGFACVSQIGERHKRLWPARRRPLIVNLPPENGKPGDARMCLNLQRCTHVCWFLGRHSASGLLRLDVREAALVALQLLPLCGFRNSGLTEALCIGMQLRKHRFQFVDIDIQYARKKLATDFFEPGFQLRRCPSALPCRLDYQEPTISGVISARNKPARLEPVKKSSDFAFVSPHRFGKPPRRSLALFRTVQEHRRLLGRHPELAKAAVKRGLQPYTGPEEPGYREFRLPLSNPSIFPLGLSRRGKGIRQESPLLPALRCSCHRFGRQNFLG